MKRLVANVTSTAMALGVGCATIWVSMSYLKQPEDTIDWVVLILSGVTTGIIAFFMTWGHFQEDPKPEGGIGQR